MGCGNLLQVSIKIQQLSAGTAGNDGFLSGFTNGLIFSDNLL